MSAIVRRIAGEPVLVSALVAALIALGVAFGLNLTPEQVGSIMAVVTAVLALVVRAKVTPVVGPQHQA